MTFQPAPGPDDMALLDGCLGLNREWTVYRAGRRWQGGKPIDHNRGRARRAFYAAYAAAHEFINRHLQVDALDTNGLDESGPVDGQGWMSISEYAKSKGTGPRKARKVMEGVELLRPEIECRAIPCITDPRELKPAYRHTLRLALWAVQAGFGKRITPRNGPAFDMLSPDGVEWLDARWPAEEVKPADGKSRRGRPTSGLRDQVKALMAEGRSQAEIARLLGKSKQSVYRQMKALKQAA